MIINFVQDIATPHNNILLKELNNDKDINLNIWYCHEKHPQYNWDHDLTNEIKEAKIYKSFGIDWKFIKYCLNNKDEKYFIVGWQNPSTKLLIFLFWILNRPFNIWFDYPQDNSKRSILKNVFREFYYFLLKISKAKVFGVGKMTLEYFKNRGFKEERLINLPIFVDISKTKEDYLYKKEEIYKKYNIKDKDLFMSAGSRLIYEKGYDILIDAISLLDDNIKNSIKCVIVGKGEEKDNLEKQIKKCKLENNIFIEEWLEIEDFKAIIANSDIFIHPARFDAYGGTIFSMALGTPVIGSNKAGAAIDRIENSTNGLLYSGTTEELVNSIHFVFNNKHMLSDFSKKSIEVASLWHPKNGLEIIRSNIK